ncbi:hypothetical protein CYE04_29440 (plasmid) [Klebsiella pneumoniae]|nr:hypothetical protein CYE04_29440 [Klebsiella pneumoniae]
MSCRSSLHVPCRGENTRSKCPFKFDHNSVDDAGGVNRTYGDQSPVDFSAIKDDLYVPSDL